MASNHRFSLFVLFSTLLYSVTVASTEDWPQWRGQNRDAVWNETGVVESFSSAKLEPKWSAEISSGYSGPTVADGRVYLMDKVTSPTEMERILCIDSETGEKLWDYAYETNYEIDFALGPRASVTIADNKAYTLGSMGYATCLDASTGSVLWEKDLKEAYNVSVPIWGISPSPLVHDEKVIYLIGGSDGACVVALNTTNGEEVWRALDEPGSYSSPILIQQAGRTVLICWTGRSFSGLNPDTGEIYWTHPFRPKKMIINVPTPVFDGEHLFFSSFYDGSTLLKVHPDKLEIEVVWERSGRSENNTDALHCMIGTPFIEGDYIYGVDSYGQLRCIKLENGDRVWEDLSAVANRRWGTIHMVRNQDKVWMFNEAGELIIAKLSPEGFQEISRTKLIEPTSARSYQEGDVSWSHPAFANKHIFLRNDKELICVSLES